MASIAPGTYNLAELQLSIGGRRIEGYGPDEVCTISWDGPLAVGETGADGQDVRSLNNNGTGIATITVSETGPGYKVLGELLKDDELVNTTTTPARAFQLLDPINGDNISSAYAYFTDRPEVSKARTAGTRVFVMRLPNAGPSAAYGVAITL